MANMLRKDKNITYLPGSAAIPAYPGQPWLPAYDAQVTQNVCEWVYSAVIDPPGAYYGWYLVPATTLTPEYYWYTLLDMYGQPTGGTVSYSSSYVCTLKLVTVHYPEQPYIAPVSAVGAVASQTLIDLNLGWNAGARSQDFMTGSGRIDFEVPQGVIGAVVGLNDIDTDAGYANINYAWYFSGGTARVYEDGVLKYYSGPYATDDVFSVERLVGVVNYKKNGTTAYTSSVYSTGTMFMDASLYAGDDSVYDPLVVDYGVAVNSFEPMAGAGGNVAYSFSHTSFLPMTGTSHPANRSAASFEPMDGLGSNRIYGDSDTYFLPMTTFAQGGMPMPSFSISNTAMLYMTGGATGLTGEIGGGDNSFELMDTMASDHAYGESVTSFAPMVGYASAYEGNNTASMHCLLGVIDWVALGGEVYVVMTSNMTVASVFALQSVLSADLKSTATLTATQATMTILQALMQTDVTAGFGVPVFDQASSVWVVNANTGASSQYEQYDFNSFGQLGGRYYGCKTDGLYSLDGDTDTLDAVRASVGFGNKNFGDSSLKRVSHCYLGVSSTGDMYLKVTVEGSEYVYEARRSDASMRTQRVDIGKGLRANYFQFELYNNNGCDFELSSIEFAPVVLSRRI